MSYFNDEQREEMKYLASLSPEERCWCGWYKKGKCDTCAPDDMMADRQKVTCICGGYPAKRGGAMRHIGYNCPNDTKQG